MDITCGYCNNKFVLDKIHIKRELTEENPIIKALYGTMFGTKPQDKVYKYFLYCPKCHQKIARFDY